MKEITDHRTIKYQLYIGAILIITVYSIVSTIKKYATPNTKHIAESQSRTITA